MRYFLWLTFGLCLISGPSASEPVTVDTFVRAETDTAIRNFYNQGGLGKFNHYRQPIPLDEQLVIRMNRDTLYSTAVLDLSKDATVTLPDTGSRYMSLHVINQDHYMFVITKPGPYKLTMDSVGSRYVSLSIRLFIDATDPKDIAVANALQDRFKIEGGASEPLDLPDWNQEQLRIARGALNTLAKLGMDPSRAFGTRDNTDPIQFVLGAAAGWGGLPKINAIYDFEMIEKNDGTPFAVKVKDAPVDAFWSITVYNSDGFIEKNDRGAYSFNNVTAKTDKNGAITIHFGGCNDGRANCLPITKGWGYVARMYQPREEILNGSWVFPVPKPVK